MNKTIIIFGIIFLVILGWFFWSEFSAPEGDIVARNGLHWHADLSIDILGEMQDIPAGIGLARLPHNPMHTHDRDSVIHMEFAGLVKKDDLKLSQFFNIWGKTFDRDCIFDKCSGQAGQLKMLVSGKENPDFENYAMKDGDKIAIIFKPEVLSEIKEITVIGTNFAFNPSVITVKSGERVKINFKNETNMIHNFTIDGLGSGSSGIEFTAPAPGTYVFYCSIPGHKAAGMAGSLIVE